MNTNEHIEGLREDRQGAVLRWLASSIGDCVVCTTAVLVADPHEVSKDGFQHLNCDAQVI
jgi:hypothetical protein